MKRQAAYLAALASILLVWQVASLFLPPYLLPGIPKTVTRLMTGLLQGELPAQVAPSFLRLGLGYSLGLLLGGFLGLLAGLSRTFGRYLRSLVSLLQSVPPITWVPFLIILFDFGSIPVVVVVAMATFFPMALAVLNGTEGVNRTHIELAQVMGASRWQVLTKVYLPEVMPVVITGAQVSFGNAYRNLIAAEMVSGASAGLGWTISYAGETADMAGVLAGILVVGASAALIDNLLLERAKRRLLHWRSAGGEQIG